MELKARIGSIIILMPIMVWIIWMGGAVYNFVAIIAAMRLCYEWFRILGYNHHPSIYIGIFIVAIICLMASLGHYEKTIWICFSFLVVSAVCMMFRLKMALAFCGLFYACATGIALIILRADPEYGFIGILFICAVVWSTDISAYCIGKVVGGAKLCPKISPKKTWSGSLGGLVGGIAAGTIIAVFIGGDNSMLTMLIAGLLSLMTQFGDLLESLLKRTFDVKDSGNLIPGHGGLLDRLDGFGVSITIAALIGIIHAGTHFVATGLLIW